jgi:hypothetical protein
LRPARPGASVGCAAWHTTVISPASWFTGTAAGSGAPRGLVPAAGPSARLGTRPGSPHDPAVAFECVPGAD